GFDGIDSGVGSAGAARALFESGANSFTCGHAGLAVRNFLIALAHSMDDVRSRLLAGKRHRVFEQIALDDAIYDAFGESAVSGDRRTRGTHLQRGRDAAKTRQALRAAGARNDPEIDFRLPDLC